MMCIDLPTVRTLAALSLGDPTIAAWVIVACYFAAAALCAQALRVARIGAKTAAEWPGSERVLVEG